MNSQLLQFGLACGLVAFSSVLTASEAVDFETPEPGSYTLPVIKSAADGEVLNAKAEALRLSQFIRGKVTVMSFIYTRCAAVKACPMATGVLRELRERSTEDPTLAKGLRLVRAFPQPLLDQSRGAEFDHAQGVPALREFP